MATRRILAASCIAFTTAWLAACGPAEQKSGPSGAPGPGGAAPPPPEVEVITVAAAAATVTRELPGRLQAVRTAQVRARVEGIVEQRLFKEGSDVKAGTPLFRLDDRTYRANVAAAMADHAAARQAHERNRRLLEQKMVSLQNYEQAEARMKQADAALARARLDVENARVLAPISGRIGRALVTEGALVGKGEATHLATIEQLDPIYANFTQSNADLLRLQQALKAGKLKRADSAQVELLLEDGSAYALPGKVLFADLAVDPGTGSVQMRAEFPNPQRELLPGTFVRIRFPEAEMEQAIRVPQRAVLMSPQGQSVMIVDAEGKAVPRPVKVGAMAGTDWIVAEGLNGGEQVIVSGLQKARPGAPVKAVPAGAAPPAAHPAAAAGK
ncbi:MAG: efflux RND transporter periplasmic adaptor subunit [Rhodocyclaceae bacterium]|nr:MAG: efflux RND transporter periplasmic adaptor subunit [Rhodocyclaceae bacterium]MBE7422959.1 efflux RND transporter periplasmic adaptor subunit [Zoogloeaceae bacterium]MCK6385793.1 efflux RND transporter periplasmic adaptor subunit [Rhodocyclaceae bacterium]